MDFFLLATLLAIGLQLAKIRYQKGRIALLASHLGAFQIEKLMETLTSGYLRALGEADNDRRAQIWQLLQSTETTLADQLGRLAIQFARVEEGATRVSRLPVAIPYADRLLAGLPQASFDLRQAIFMHAKGVTSVLENQAELPYRSKAFTLSAELYLLQHTCHWFCKSQAVASARLLARHRTSHAEVLAAVSPATRAAYRNLTGI